MSGTSIPRPSHPLEHWLVIFLRIGSPVVITRSFIIRRALPQCFAIPEPEQHPTVRLFEPEADSKPKLKDLETIKCNYYELAYFDSLKPNPTLPLELASLQWARVGIAYYEEAGKKNLKKLCQEHGIYNPVVREGYIAGEECDETSKPVIAVIRELGRNQDATGNHPFEE